MQFPLPGSRDMKCQFYRSYGRDLKIHYSVTTKKKKKVLHQAKHHWEEGSYNLFIYEMKWDSKFEKNKCLILIQYGGGSIILWRNKESNFMQKANAHHFLKTVLCYFVPTHNYSTKPGLRMQRDRKLKGLRQGSLFFKTLKCL